MKIVLLAALAILASVSAHATEIDISAGPNGYGCTSCYGGFRNGDVAPGTTVTLVNQGETGPLQATLGGGTYVITNARTSGIYSAWDFQGYPSSSNWAWSYIIGSDNGDGTATILQTGGVDDFSNRASTQAQMAALTNVMTYSYNTLLAATSTATFSNTLTLNATTNLDFFIDDGFLPDNGGGVALDIEPQGGPPNAVPEPATILVIVSALACLVFGRRVGRS